MNFFSLAPLLATVVMNLTMDFHAQAPLQNWDNYHEDFCEEASVILALDYWSDTHRTNREFDRELFRFYEIEKKVLNSWRSNTVAEMVKVLNLFAPDYETMIITNPTAADIVKELLLGRPVLLPLAGRDLKNPYYRRPGPVYHWLVVKGVDGNNFITHDVGTRRGANYRYPKKLLMDAIHDWDPADIHRGARRVLVIYPKNITPE